MKKVGTTGAIVSGFGQSTTATLIVGYTPITDCVVLQLAHQGQVVTIQVPRKPAGEPTLEQLVTLAHQADRHG